jgi:hypothetical protein
LLSTGRAARVQHGGATVPRGTHSQYRAALSASAFALLLLATPAAAQSTGLAPYRFNPPTGNAPLDQEKQRVYQDQLRQALPPTAPPPPNATGAARQQEQRQELDRIGRLRQSPPPPPPVTFAPPPQERGPVTSSGGHPQPTPAEIEEREKERQRRQQQPPAPTKPVYDLFGDRIQ